MEIEFKLSCTPETASLLGRQLTRLTGGSPLRLKLQNTYYDTPQQNLRAAGIALRIRQQGDLSLQTVKCAGQVSGGFSSRPEWETPYTGRFDFTAIDDETTRQQLETLARLPGYRAMLDTNFSRHIWHWRPEAGTQIEIVLDRGRILAGGKQEAICELELELVEGPPERLLDLVARLGSLAPIFPAPLSKATRGSLLLSGTSKAPLAEPPATGDAASAFTALAQACLDQISLNLPANYAHFAAENVHQVRVGLRRLRALLKLFRPLLREKWCLQEITDGARSHMRALAPARNLQVVLDDIIRPAADMVEARAWQRLEQRLASQAEGAFAEARTYLVSQGFAHWLLHTSLALHVPPLHGKAQTLAWPACGRQLVGRQLKAYAKRLRQTKPSPESLHELRKDGKHLRYQLDVTGLAQTQDGKALARRLAQLQGRLGQLNDLYSATDILNAQPVSYTATIAGIGASHLARHADLLKDASRRIKRLERDLRALRSKLKDMHA